MSFFLVTRSLVGVLLTVATATNASAQLPRLIPPSLASPKVPPPRFVPSPATMPKGSGFRPPSGSLPKNLFGAGTPKSAYKLPVTPRIKTPGTKSPSSTKGKPPQLFQLSFDKPKPADPSPLKPKPVKPQPDPPGPIQPVRPVGPVRPIGR
jgi:hypothetical protein